ncbi:hypothetical protein O163_10405 [Caldanaerobacter subterraneus subsp. yonseiensis KB-1]|uniref:Uncharacterized protein n=1 Tax=Caldanaerobacter subterraneus subsp. yonseiensis KB-1 TaxID=1388761 RepID=U5CNW0_CALSX|nr:hypothetical protein [Caldanaerobacter subterraneus]ERM91469.1 hypothetical protein O163_10405 [Caldanaerobacter subterraneus subsp. yonseiensis KB-1]
MQYGFRTRKEDKELDDVLSNLKGKERTDFIRDALYFYIRNKDTIEQISRDISEIKEMLKKHSSIPNTSRDVAKNNQNNHRDKNKNEEILKELVNDFLNM